LKSVTLLTRVSYGVDIDVNEHDSGGTAKISEQDYTFVFDDKGDTDTENDIPNETIRPKSTRIL